MKPLRRHSEKSKQDSMRQRLPRNTLAFTSRFCRGDVCRLYASVSAWSHGRNGCKGSE